MIKVENIDVWGFGHAIRGMRNPMNSWDKSDSKYCEDIIECDKCKYNEYPNYCNNPTANGEDFVIGDDDTALMQKLYRAGVEHRTYARMIWVWMDITAPLYWWKEMDRYTVGKTQISTSTMHKIHAKEFELDDFSHEHLVAGLSTLEYVIDVLNIARNVYLKSKSKEDWWQIIQLLPSSYNQRRTICMSYEVVLKIIKERTGHKLDEWNDFVELLRQELPYVREIVEDNDDLSKMSEQ